MAKKKSSPVRLNIYVHDPDLRRQIKEMTARKEVSISDYCLRAIKTQLLQEQKTEHEEENVLKKAVKKAQLFQETFGAEPLPFALRTLSVKPEKMEVPNDKGCGR